MIPKWYGSTLSEYRARVRSGARFIAKLDVARCYPSIYTHSIPWALHTKATAKTIRDKSLIGNVIDKVVRENQDGQTIGLPIGPDTSFVLSEMILSSIDSRVGAGLAGRGWRWYDDYEVGFDTEDDASAFCALLERELAGYELEVNPRKTEVLRLPQPLDDAWYGPLQVYELKAEPGAQAASLIDFFNRAFTAYKEFPKVGLLKYAVRKLYRRVPSGPGRRPIVHPFHWDLAQHLISQIAVVEPDALPTVLGLLSFYDSQGMAPDKKLLSQTLSRVVEVQANHGNSSDVAWAIWGFIENEIEVPAETAQVAADAADDVIGLLLLHARSLGLVTAATNFDGIEALVAGSSFESDHWLIAYESHYHGWLSAPHTDLLAKNAHVTALLAGDVHFYRAKLRRYESARHIFGTPPWLLNFVPYA